MIDLWIDANILLRFLTGEPTELANRALRLFGRADRGEVRLHVSPLIVAETVWVLTSFYKYPKAQIRKARSRHSIGIFADPTLTGSRRSSLIHSNDYAPPTPARERRARKESPLKWTPIVFFLSRV